LCRPAAHGVVAPDDAERVMTELRSAALLERLVAFPTISRDSNADMIGCIAETLRGAGGDVRILPGIFPQKCNLIASFGPTGGDGVVLSGHSDVVPVEGQAWTSDPFTLRAQDGRLYGRGSSDMKGFIACAIAAAARTGAKHLKRPLHIAISHDEETGCIGVRSMLDTLVQEGFSAAACIVGEPTGMRIANGHKGKFAGCIHCRGQAAHSANPGLGCNAIYLAADMIQELRALQDWLMAHGARDAAYEVPYSTVHVGTIEGGTALNIVPEACDLKFEFRLLPGDMPDALLARLRDAAANLTAAAQASGRHAAIDIAEINRYPGLATAPDAPIVETALAAGAAPVLFKAGFGAEAGLFDGIGLPAIVCGPGSIDRAHKPDEYITMDELDACDAFLDRLLA
jgi:acetylornithine deacetylase